MGLTRSLLAQRAVQAWGLCPAIRSLVQAWVRRDQGCLGKDNTLIIPDAAKLVQARGRQCLRQDPVRAPGQDREPSLPEGTELAL